VIATLRLNTSTTHINSLHPIYIVDYVITYDAINHVFIMCICAADKSKMCDLMHNCECNRKVFSSLLVKKVLLHRVSVSTVALDSASDIVRFFMSRTCHHNCCP
jgi:hypothetical protein